MSKIYEGDIGTVFNLNTDPFNTGVDLTGYTLKMEFQKPDGTSFERSATLKSGSSCILQYTIANGDLDTAGDWIVQAKISLDTNVWLGESARFRVYAPFA